MRALTGFIVALLAIVIIVALAIFAIQNLNPVNAHFLGYAFTPNLWWIVVGCAVLGFLLAAIVLAPGRFAAGWRARSLARSHAQTEAELAALQEQHAQLQAERDRLAAQQSGLQAERDQLYAQREQQLQAARERQMQAERDQQALTNNNEQVRADGAQERVTQPVAPPATDTAVPQQRTTVYTHEPETPDQAPETSPDGASDQPSLGERLRGMFRGPDTTDDQAAGTYDQPPAPTA